MHRRAGLALALGLWIGAAGAAHADFSACGSALQADDPQMQIRLYTTCLTKGGIAATDRAGAFNNRGYAYMRLGDGDRALADFSASIENDPTWNIAFVNRARIYVSRGELDKAEADLDHALKTTPGENWPNALLLRTRVRLERGDLQAARADLDLAVRKAGKSPDIYVEAARLLSSWPDPAFRDPAKAVELAREAVRRRDDANAHDLLASALAATGKYDEAAAEENRAIDLVHRKGGDASAMGERLERYQRSEGSRDSGG